MALQGVVNNKGLFTDIYIGWPGRVHNPQVFANSSLYWKGQDPRLHGWRIQPKYPLLPWLMKAFPDTGNSSRQQKIFNYRLSKARVVVEHSYGKLKGRWRCLLKRLDRSSGIFASEVQEYLLKKKRTVRESCSA